MSLLELKNLAKERNHFRPIPAPRPTLLDIKIPEINVPVLKPEVVTSKKPKIIEKVVEKSITTVNDWLDWLRNAGKDLKRKVSPKVEKLKQKINNLLESRNI